MWLDLPVGNLCTTGAPLSWEYRHSSHVEAAGQSVTVHRHPSQQRTMATTMSLTSVM